MPTTLLRFLLLAPPLVLLALGAFHYGGELLGLPVPRLPGPFLLGLWVLEAIGLVALFLLVRERLLDRWIAGAASAWTAWIFRGPVLALSSAGGSVGPIGEGAAGSGSWGPLVLAWLGLYTVCGLLMASVAGSLDTTSETP
jgi:hypothetical protein